MLNLLHLVALLARGLLIGQAHFNANHFDLVVGWWSTEIERHVLVGLLPRQILEVGGATLVGCCVLFPDLIEHGLVVGRALRWLGLVLTLAEIHHNGFEVRVVWVSDLELKVSLEVAERLVECFGCEVHVDLVVLFEEVMHAASDLSLRWVADVLGVLLQPLVKLVEGECLHLVVGVFHGL